MHRDKTALYRNGFGRHSVDDIDYIKLQYIANLGQFVDKGNVDIPARYFPLP